MNKDELLTSARTILDGRDLSSEDKELWLTQLTEASAAQIEMFVKTANDAQVLRLATESLQKKASAKDDAEQMQAIIDAEVEEIKSLAHNA